MKMIFAVCVLAIGVYSPASFAGGYDGTAKRDGAGGNQSGDSRTADSDDSGGYDGTSPKYQDGDDCGCDEHFVVMGGADGT